MDSWKPLLLHVFPSVLTVHPAMDRLHHQGLSLVNPAYFILEFCMAFFAGEDFLHLVHNHVRFQAGFPLKLNVTNGANIVVAGMMDDRMHFKIILHIKTHSTLGTIKFLFCLVPP